MSSKVVINCNECGIEKTSINHWKAMFGQPEHPAFYSFEEGKQLGVPERDEIHAHYCGQECCGKAFHRWMDTGSVLKAESKPAEEPEEIVAEYEGLPPHLLNDDPVGACNKCGRKTWSSVDLGQPCAMTQPNGLPCCGIFEVIR